MSGIILVLVLNDFEGYQAQLRDNCENNNHLNIEQNNCDDHLNLIVQPCDCHHLI